AELGRNWLGEVLALRLVAEHVLAVDVSASVGEEVLGRLDAGIGYGRGGNLARGHAAARGRRATAAAARRSPAAAVGGAIGRMTTRANALVQVEHHSRGSLRVPRTLAADFARLDSESTAGR